MLDRPAADAPHFVAKLSDISARQGEDPFRTSRSFPAVVCFYPLRSGCVNCVTLYALLITPLYFLVDYPSKESKLRFLCT